MLQLIPLQVSALTLGGRRHQLGELHSVRGRDLLQHIR